LILECSSQVVLSMTPNYYQALVGTPVTFKCIGIGEIAINDIVWLYYPTGNSSFTEVIYSDGAYTNNSNLKFSVSSFNSTPGYMLTTLEIKKVELTDSLYTYQCSCNVYRACSSGFRPIADANLIAFSTTTTTTTTSTTKSKKKNNTISFFILFYFFILFIYSYY
jgi:hypothetical protein